MSPRVLRQGGRPPWTPAARTEAHGSARDDLHVGRGLEDPPAPLHRRPDRRAPRAVLGRPARRDHRAARAGGHHRRRRVGQDHRDGRPGGVAGGHRRRSAGAGAGTDVHPQGGRGAVQPGAGRPAAGRSGRRLRGGRVWRAADHDLRRLRGPAGRRARAAAGLRGRPDHADRREPVPAGGAGGQGRGGPVRVPLPAAAGDGDRAGAPAGCGPAAAPGRPRRAGQAHPRPAGGAGVGAAEQPGPDVRRGGPGRW